MSTIDEKATAAAYAMFPEDTTTSLTLRMISIDAYKIGHAAGYAEASDYDFGSGFRDGLMKEVQNG